MVVLHCDTSVFETRGNDDDDVVVVVVVVDDDDDDDDVVVDFFCLMCKHLLKKSKMTPTHGLPFVSPHTPLLAGGLHPWATRRFHQLLPPHLPAECHGEPGESGANRWQNVATKAMTSLLLKVLEPLGTSTKHTRKPKQPETCDYVDIFFWDGLTPIRMRSSRTASAEIRPVFSWAFR